MKERWRKEYPGKEAGGDEGIETEEKREKEAKVKKGISRHRSRRRWAAGGRAGYSEIESEGAEDGARGSEDGVRDTGRRKDERLRGRKSEGSED